MTIRLITGIPGSGKTLYAVSELKKEIEANLTADEPRKIYCDITGLKYDGIENPPIDWRDTPPRSLLIYDEAQLHKEFKSSRGNNSYKFVEELTIHRKTGHEIWFITQDPKRLHNDILSMVEIHHHLERPYGAKLASIFKYRGCERNPSAKTVKERAENKTVFTYDKSLFELYESSQVKDGIKFRLPKELVIWLLIAVVVAIVFYFQVTSTGTKKYVGTFLGQEAPKETAQTPKQADTATKPAEQGKTIVQAPNPQNETTELTKEQLELKLKAQELEFIRKLKAQELQSQMQFNALQKQFLEQQKQLDDFYSRLELYKTMLPKNYEIIKGDDNLKVRAVVKMGNKCKAYNTHGDLMTLSFEECDYYLKESGRVHKSDNKPVGKLETTPVADILSENPDSHKETVKHQDDVKDLDLKTDVKTNDTIKKGL
uniref:ZOT protein n=1 Tax=Dulem virus 62 TaxID=3145773 RepID=A0AAU8B3J4_9VIRU